MMPVVMRVSAGANVTVPVLVIGNSADDACTPSHTNRLFEAVGHDRKQLHVVQGALLTITLARTGGII